VILAGPYAYKLRKPVDLGFLGPGETWLARLAIAFTIYAIASALIAWLVYPNRQMALLVLWGCVLVALLNLQTVLSEDTQSKLNELALVAVPLAGTLIGIRPTAILKSRRAA
jgi:hypothetical protein